QNLGRGGRGLMLRTAADCRRDNLARKAKERRARIIVRDGKPKFDARGWDAEERWRARFRKLAVFAIAELGLDYHAFLRAAREDFQEVKLELKVNACRIKVRQSEEEKADIAWAARLKRIEHQERLAKQRKHSKKQGSQTL